MPKALTRQQLQTRKEKAVRFVRDVLGDPDRASEIEDESLESYAERRKIKLLNPRGEPMATKGELLSRIKELEDENEELQSQLDEIADIVAPPEEGEGEEDEEGE
jgi:hypothetical protein